MRKIVLISILLLSLNAWGGIGDDMMRQDGLYFKIVKNVVGPDVGLAFVYPDKENNYETLPSTLYVTDVVTGIAETYGRGEIFYVTRVLPCAFMNNRVLTTVIIGGRMETLGASAFEGCKKLESVELGKNLSNIEEKCFGKCTSLTAITFPKRIESVGNEAFKGCSSLKTVTINNPKMAIGKDAFAKCSKLKEILVPAGSRQHFANLLPKKLRGKIIEF